MYHNYNLNAYIKARIDVVHEQYEQLRQAAYSRYNAVMSCPGNNDLYCKATARDKSPRKARANALQDAALALCGHPYYHARGCEACKKWDTNEIKWLELFCVPF